MWSQHRRLVYLQEVDAIMAVNIWGVRKGGTKHELFALRFPPEEIPELKRQARKQGWSKLVVLPTDEIDGLAR